MVNKIFEKISARPRFIALLDQVLFSSVALLQIAVFARVLSATDFGVFSIVVSSILFLQGIQRSAVVLPMIVFSGKPASDAPGYKDWFFFQTRLLVGLGLLAGVILVGLSAIDGWSSRVAQVVFVLLAFPGALFYEFFRRVAFQEKRYKVILALALFYASMNYASVLLAAFFWPNLISAVLGFFIAVTLSALLGYYLLRRNFLVERVPVLATPVIRNAMWWNLLSFAPHSLYNTAVPLLLGVLAGPVSVAVYAATRVFLSPVLMLISAIDSVDKPRASRAYAETGVKGLARVLFNTAKLLFLVGGAYLLVVALFPGFAISFVLGDKYSEASGLVRLWACVGMVMLVCQPVETGLITMRLSRLIFVTRSVASLACLGVIWFFVGKNGTLAAVVGVLCSWGISSLLALAVFGRKYASDSIESRTL